MLTDRMFIGYARYHYAHPTDRQQAASQSYFGGREKQTEVME